MKYQDLPTIELEQIAWPEPAPVPTERVVTGTPETTTMLISKTDNDQMGLWKVTDGSFDTDHTGYVEFIHIVQGQGRLISKTGEVTELNAGITTLIPEGWKGRWEIDETLTKIFTIISR